MQPIYIKTSQKVLLKKYLNIFLLFSPFILIYIYSEPNNKIVFALLLAYYVPLSIIFIYEIITNHNKTLVELSEEGIKINNRDSYAWNSIYNFKTVKRRFRKQSMRRGIEIIEKTELQINNNCYNFETQYQKFSNEQIAEIIQLYKNRLDKNRPNTENLPVLNDF